MPHTIAGQMLIWNMFEKRKIGMNQREQLLAPGREEFHHDLVGDMKARKPERDTSKMMSREEMIAWSRRQGVKSRMGD